MALFNSLAQSSVERALVMAKWQAEQARMDEAADRLALYSDDYEEIIKETMAKLFVKENYDRLCYHVNGSQNILKRVVNELSMVYKSEATRTLDIASDRWEEIKDEAALDVRMKRANRLTNLLNDVIVKVSVRGGKIVYDIITPDICTVIQNEEDPTKLSGIMWLRTYVNTPSSTVIEYEYMDDLGWWCVLDKDFRVKVELANPGTFPYKNADGTPNLPLVPIHRQHPESAFWDQDSGRDLYNAAVMLGVKMTQFDYAFKTGSFKQLYIMGSNVDMPGRQIMDVTTPIKVLVDPQTQGDVGVLDLQVDFKAMVDALTYQVNTVINNYGISADMWSLSISEMSGRALKIKNRALLEQREEQIPTYRDAESDLFEKTKIVNNTHASFMGWKKIPDAATLKTDFADVEFPEDPVYELDLGAKRLNMGLISLGKFYQLDNPDVTDEQEAEKALLDNLSKLKTTRDANPTLDEYLNAIIQGGKAVNPADKQNQFGKGQEGAF
jgi:hypothetical protein